MNFERDNIRAMSGYASGEQPEDPRTIKLNTNENPYPATPAVKALLADFDPVSLRRYPPATSAAFRQVAADLHSVAPENIIATRGGDELLRLVITTFVNPGERIGMTYPTYSLYPVLAQIQDCPIVEVPLTDTWQIPATFAADMNAAGVKLTFVVNPHAPTGALVPLARIEAIARELDGILLLDEAYIDFAETPADSPAFAVREDNVILLRTLSKGYSLAGLRFGYGIAAPSLISPMMVKTRDSYNLDAISQQLAAAALGDQAYASSTWDKVKTERQRVADALAELGFEVLPSEANFLLVKAPMSSSHTAADIYQRLKEKHILVRYFDADRLRDKLRITIGTADENTVLISNLKEVLNQT